MFLKTSLHIAVSKMNARLHLFAILYNNSSRLKPPGQSNQVGLIKQRNFSIVLKSLTVAAKQTKLKHFCI